MSKVFCHNQTKQDWNNFGREPALPLFCVSLQVHAEKKQRDYDPAMRKQAVQLYVDGMNLRRIARLLGIHHRTVADWVKAHAENLPETPMPGEVKTAE